MRLATWACVAAIGMMLAAGCEEKKATPATTPGGTSSGGAGGSDKKLKLAFVTNNASDFWTIARAGTEKATQEVPNVQVEFKIPSDGTAATQKRILDDLLAAGVDGIAISPVDPKNQTAHLNEVAKQTLLICHDSDAPESQRGFYVGTDNVAAGRMAADLVKKALPGGGKIMVFVGMKDAQNARERYQGLEEALKGSNVSIIDLRTDDTDRIRAKANVLDAIVKYPDVAGFVGLWSYNGPAILNAVKESDKVGKIQIIAFDEEDETLQGLKDGAIYSTVVQQPYEFGRQAITLMAKAQRGDKSFVPADKRIIIPTRAVDKSGVDAFWADLKAKRGK